MVVFDTSTLVLSLDPDKARPPIDPTTGLVLTNCKNRVDHLIDQLSSVKDSILIPAPVLSEYLMKAGPNKNEYVDKVTQSKNFTIGVFDTRAAIELALLNDPDLAKAVLDEKTTRAKLRIDRQIVAIAKVNGATCVYTSDNGLAICARNNGIKAVMTWELPEPPQSTQVSLFGE